MLSLATRPAVVHRPPVMSGRETDELEARMLGQALAQLRAASGRNQAEAGGRIGVTAQAWGKYEAGRAPSIFRPDVQARLASAVGASVEELLAARDRVAERGPLPPARQLGPRLVAVERREPVPENRPPAGMVAVYGLAAGAGERIVTAAGSEIRWVPMHPAQRGYARAGAVEVVGESMYPRYKPRELAYFVFDLPPPRGEDVVIELHDGTALIKEYVGRTATHLMVKEFFPAERTFDLPLAEVKALHAVVG